jgi:hypothetical protein
MVERIEACYRARGRTNVPTHANYSIDELIKVMRLFQLPMDDILSH